MEFMDGICKTRECAWDVLLSESMKDQEATVEGAIHSIRNMGDVAFVILRKKEGLFQTVYENDKTNVSIHDLKEAMCVRLTGTLHEEERAPHGRELRISHVEILSSPAEPLPLAIDKWKLNTSLEAKLNYRPIALRNVQERAKFKIQEALVRAFRDYLYEKGFTEIHTPKIGARGAEGGANLFKLSYFHKPAVLAQSPQFYKQMMVGVFDRVFETGPVFRAEKHNTKRHLNEYTSLDFEMGYINGFEDIMEMETGFLQYAVELLKKDYAHELSILKVELPKVDKIQLIGIGQFGDLRQVEGCQTDTDTDQDGLGGLSCRLLVDVVLLHGNAVRVPHLQTVKQNVQRGLVVLILFLYLGRT